RRHRDQAVAGERASGSETSAAGAGGRDGGEQLPGARREESVVAPGESRGVDELGPDAEGGGAGGDVVGGGGGVDAAGGEELDVGEGAAQRAQVLGAAD